MSARLSPSQTSHSSFPSIDEDIVTFLMSRYGIDISGEEVRRHVIRGLGGGDEEQDGCIDLMELVAILLIPTLLKASSDELPQGVIEPRSGMLKYVLSMILHDVRFLE